MGLEHIQKSRKLPGRPWPVNFSHWIQHKNLSHLFRLWLDMLFWRDFTVQKKTTQPEPFQHAKAPASLGRYTMLGLPDRHLRGLRRPKWRVQLPFMAFWGSLIDPDLEAVCWPSIWDLSSDHLEGPGGWSVTSVYQNKWGGITADWCSSVLFFIDK